MRVNPNLKNYRVILELIYDDISYYNYTTERDYIYLSLKEIQSRLKRYGINRTLKNLSKIISFFALIGLIKKLSDYDVDMWLLYMSYNRAIESGDQHRISYFFIPRLT